MMSTTPPGGNGTTTRTGRVGYCWARATSAIIDARATTANKVCRIARGEVHCPRFCLHSVIPHTAHGGLFGLNVHCTDPAKANRVPDRLQL